MSPIIRIRKNVKGRGNIKTSWDTGPVREVRDTALDEKISEIKPRVKKLEYPRLKQILYKRALEGK